MAPIRVVPYDPDWPGVFDRLRGKVWPEVCDHARTIEHVGSTSVPGLAAKPIIDMSIVVADRADMPAVIAALARLGYRSRGDLGVPDREAFHNPPGLPGHHLYACLDGSLGLRNHLAVRDHLRAHPDTAHAYGELKMRLAREHPEDIDAYIAGKTPMLLEILRQSGIGPEQLRQVHRINTGQ